MSIRRIFWDKDILSYDDTLDYKLTSNDIRSNAVFLKKIDVLFQIKSKQLFFDLLNAMIQLAEKTTTYVIKKTGWQDNGSYAFGNGVICQTNSANFSIDSRITKYKLYIAPNSEVTPDQERASADLLFSNMEKLNDKTLFYYLYLYHLLALMATPLRERYEVVLHALLLFSPVNPQSEKLVYATGFLDTDHILRRSTSAQDPLKPDSLILLPKLLTVFTSLMILRSTPAIKSRSTS